MKYSIELSNNQQYIIVTIDGTLNNTSTLICAKESHKLAAENGVTNFLLDFRKATTKGSILEKHEIKNDFDNSNEINKSAKVAILVNENDNSHNLTEMLFRKGGYMVKIFKDLDGTLNYFGN